MILASACPAHFTSTGVRRGRGLGLVFPGTTGHWNAITDVVGVEVGTVTLIAGEGPLVVGNGPIRTGVTAILPRGKAGLNAGCAAGSFSLNGNGEMTGLAWIEEAGLLDTPIAITNTNSCGVARDAIAQWLVSRRTAAQQDWGLPVAAETFDGDLNDIDGFHVTKNHVFEALDNAASGPLELGNVGGGTGMITYDFKGGSGSASRKVEISGDHFTLGVFVQSNFGQREDLVILGVPVGQHIGHGKLRGKEQGSIIAVVATDAPLLPHQLKRLARRVPLGLARTGTIASNSSGDIFLAFSTANEAAFSARKARDSLDALSDHALDPLFRAVVEAVEEAIIDAMICGTTMTGRDGNVAISLPQDSLLQLLASHDRLTAV
jgi:D-aminopeptidase